MFLLQFMAVRVINFGLKCKTADISKILFVQCERWLHFVAIDFMKVFSKKKRNLGATSSNLSVKGRKAFFLRLY